MKRGPVGITFNIYNNTRELLQEFENLRTRVELISDEDVTRLANDWEKFLIRQLMLTEVGHKKEAGGPCDSLVLAIRSEIGT